MGRGSVGDVTFYRSNGMQISRARNRSPHNPKTDAQIVQRAISATIVQVYKAGKAIFDHSFEGKEVPGGNQRRFLQVNMKKLRSQVVAELDSVEPSAALASVISPGSTYPVPNSYRISEGSLFQNLFTISVVDNGGVDGLQAVLAEAQEGESIAQYAARLGLTAGEIFTIVGLGINPTGTVNDFVSPQTAFGFVRLTVKDVSQSTTAMSAATYQDFFVIDSSGSTFPGTQLITLGLNIDQVVSDNSALTGAMGIIRSNENSGLRSTCDMVTPKALSSENDDLWGVKSPLLIDAWSQTAGQVQSPLILEGGGF